MIGTFNFKSANRSHHRSRSSQGSITAVIVIAAIGIVFVLAIGVVVSFLLMSQKRSQSQTEQLALTWSTSLNKDNWTGNMNNMTGFSREMVYTSRRDLDEITQKHARLKPLALQLLEEARQAAVFVDEGRKELIIQELKAMKNEVRSGAAKANDAKSKLSVPWVATEKQVISKVEIGSIEGVPSNVYLADGIPELKEFDLQTKYAQKNGTVFNGNINAKLPSPDDDLDFKISSLPAPVKGTISPARLTSNNVFRRSFTLHPGTEKDFTKCEHLPSAIQVESQVTVTSPAAQKGNSGTINVTVTSAAPGATLSLP